MTADNNISDKIRLLLVEDDKDSATATKLMLERRGVVVTSVYNAVDAVKELDAGGFDAVVSDIRMPGMNGVALLEHIRGKDPDFPVILFTAFDSVETAIQAVRLKAQDYIPKPLHDINELLLPIKKAVRNRRLQLINQALEEREKDMQARLVRSERIEALALIAGGVAHDLNNALGALVGVPELIADYLSEPIDSHKLANARECLNEIREGASRAVATTRHLLALSRQDGFAAEVVDINAAVERYLRTPEWKSLASGRPEIRIETQLGDGIPPFNGSEAQLFRAFTNLIANAFDAMPGGGVVSITTSRETPAEVVMGYVVVEAGDYAVVRIRDNGTGISQEHIDRIFEPFFTTKKPANTTGTGIGLTIVHRIMKNHKGFVDVKSESGNGAEFALYFPVCRR